MRILAKVGSLIITGVLLCAPVAVALERVEVHADGSSTMGDMSGAVRLQFDRGASGSLERENERRQRERRLERFVWNTFPALSKIISYSGTNQLMSQCLAGLSSQIGKPIPMSLGTNDFTTKEFVLEKVSLVNALKYLVAFNDSILDVSKGRLVCRPVSQALALNESEYRLLHLMSTKHFQEAAELLREERFNVAHIRDYDDRTLLHLAAAHNETAMVERLIALGAPINARDDTGYTPLHDAVRNDHLECVQCLLKHGADTTIPNSNNNVPALTAVFYGYRDIAQAFASSGAPVDIFTAAGLGMAGQVTKMLNDGVRYENIQSNYIAQKIPKDGLSFYDLGDPYHTEPGSYLGIYNVSPLHWAARGGSLEVVSLLIANGESVSLRDSNGETPLFWAVAAGEVPAAAQLIQSGADCNATNEFGATLLLIAARSTDVPELTSLLLAAGANPNARDSHGENALHKLAWFGCPERNIETAKLLLNAGADLNAKNDDGKTPLDILLNNSFQNAGLVEVFRNHLNVQVPRR